MFEIIPSPGTEIKNWSEMEKRIEIIKPFVKTVHIDVCDGKFANNVTFADPEPFKKYTSDLLFEVHLMTEEPIQYLEAWAAAGFKRFIGQVEKMSDQVAFVTKAEEVGYAGLAIDGPSGLEKLQVSHLDLDTVLIMTIQAGFSGQQFQPEQLEKVRALTKDTELFPVEVDGGINQQTISEAWKAGARRFVTTSAIFNSDEPEAAYKTLHTMCDKMEESSWKPA